MIKIIDENVFDSKAECIVNTINCVGFMGKGLALEFALRYPKLEFEYKQQCKEHNIHTGKLYFYNIDGQKIINFPTKFHFSKPSKMEWIEQGLDFFIENFKKWEIKSCAFPLLGSRNGLLNPTEVIELMKKKLSKVDIDIFICLNIKDDELSKKLLEKYNSINLFDLIDRLSLNKKQAEVLIKSKGKISKLIEISDLPSIGNLTYRKIFNYLNKAENDVEQLSLF